MNVIKKITLTFLTILLILPIYNVSALEVENNPYEIGIIAQKNIDSLFVPKIEIDEQLKEFLSKNIKKNIEYTKKLVKFNRHINPALYLRRY